MPKQPPTTVNLSKREAADMNEYLHHADPNYIGHTGWGIETWTESHGETRSKSKYTFHIGARRDHNGDYLTCILLQVRGRNRAVEGTIVNWGPEEPSMAEVLEYYQMMFLGYYPIDRPGRGGNNNNGGEGGSGGGGGWTKEVYRNDEYGEYYYVDEEGDYQSCDKLGNPIYATDSTGNQTKNYYGLVLVFANSKHQTYYYSRGKQEACSLEKDSRGRYFFVDYKGRKHGAQYFGSEPRWMHRKKSTSSSGQSYGKQSSSGQSYGKQSSSGQSYGKQSSSGQSYGKQSSSGQSYGKQSSSAYSQPSSHKPKSTTSGPQIFTDKTGRKYYVDRDGKPRWL